MSTPHHPHRSNGAANGAAAAPEHPRSTGSVSLLTSEITDDSVVAPGAALGAPKLSASASASVSGAAAASAQPPPPPPPPPPQPSTAKALPIGTAARTTPFEIATSPHPSIAFGHAGQQHTLTPWVADMGVLKPGTRTNTSKYDFVSVKVFLADHYYVLSRFLISRILTVIKVPFEQALGFALDLKKALVDEGMLVVQQSMLEERLFRLLASQGFGEKYVRRYRIITRFYHERTPLIVLIGGTGCIGKSQIATQLCERLNLPAVVQTDLIYDLLCRLRGRAPSEIWHFKYVDDDTTLARYREECDLIRQGVENDIQKALQEGKPIIIEGLHINFAEFKTLLASANDSSAVVVPILLRVNEKDHDSLVESWVSTCKHPSVEALGATLAEQTESLLKHYRAVDRFLFAQNVATVFDCNVHRADETVSMLHSFVLDRIASVVQL